MFSMKVGEKDYAFGKLCSKDYGFFFSEASSIKGIAS